MTLAVASRHAPPALPPRPRAPHAAGAVRPSIHPRPPDSTSHRALPPPPNPGPPRPGCHGQPRVSSFPPPRRRCQGTFTAPLRWGRPKTPAATPRRPYSEACRRAGRGGRNQAPVSPAWRPPHPGPGPPATGALGDTITRHRARLLSSGPRPRTWGQDIESQGGGRQGAGRFAPHPGSLTQPHGGKLRCLSKRDGIKVGLFGFFLTI